MFFLEDQDANNAVLNYAGFHLPSVPQEIIN